MPLHFEKSLLFKSNNGNILINRSIEETYFFSTLDFLSEIKEEYTNARIDLYSALSESTNQQIISESFSNFFDSAREVITKFIEFIRNLVDRFITSLNKIIKSDKYLKKYKNDILSFSSEHEFPMSIYNYTFSSNIPNIHAEEEFDKIFADLKKMTVENRTIESIKKVYDDYCNSLEDKYNWTRAKIIGLERSIYQSDYAQELFDIYRDGGTKNTTTITFQTVSLSYHRFENYIDNIRSIEKQKSSIESDYNEIRKKLMHINSSDNGKIKLKANNVDFTSTYLLNDDMMNTWDLLIKAHVDEIINISSMHALAFSAKLDALKECYRQDKVILYNALQQVQKKSLREQDELQELLKSI